MLFKSVNLPLVTYRLNQDCLENFFSQVRGRGGNRDHPTPEQFRAAFRDIQVDALLVVSKYGNCEEDIDSFLLGLENLKGNKQVAYGETVPHVNPHVSLSEHDYSLCFSKKTSSSALAHQETNVLAYIGGFVLRKSLKKFCQDCQLLSTANADSSVHRFINLKNFDTFRNLIKPSESVVELLSVAEHVFNHNIDYYAKQPFVKGKLMSCLLDGCSNDFTDCNTCCSKTTILRLFLTVRLHHSLRLYNNTLAESSVKRKSKKYVKLSS